MRVAFGSAGVSSPLGAGRRRILRCPPVGSHMLSGTAGGLLD